MFTFLCPAYLCKQTAETQNITIHRPRKEPSMYQRLSAHLTSVEILSELHRESSATLTRISSINQSAPEESQTVKMSVTSTAK